MAVAAVVHLGASASSDLFGHVVSTRAFATGLVYGAFAYLFTGVLAALRHRTREGGGIAFAAATVIGGRDAFGPDVASGWLMLALVLLGGGGMVAVRMRSRIWAAWYVTFGRTALALAPGAAALALAFPIGTPAWLRFAAAGGTLAAGVLVHDFDATQGPRGAPFLLLGLAALAVYYTVPDTELPLVMLGAAVPLVLISVPQPLRRLGPAGSAAAMGAFSWVVVVGGRARAGAVVAGIAALGLLLVEPIARRIPKSTVSLGRKRKRTPAPRSDRWLVVVGVAAVAQAALGGFCATFAGRENDAVLAALMLAPALVLLGAAAPAILPVGVPPSRPRPGRARRGPRRFAWMH